MQLSTQANRDSSLSTYLSNGYLHEPVATALITSLLLLLVHSINIHPTIVSKVNGSLRIRPLSALWLLSLHKTPFMETTCHFSIWNKSAAFDDLANYLRNYILESRSSIARHQFISLHSLRVWLCVPVRGQMHLQGGTRTHNYPCFRWICMHRQVSRTEARSTSRG